MAYLNLMRVRQWYKNLLIFLPLIFVGQLFNGDSFTLIAVGFFSLCLISSSGYIINDIFDRKFDLVHSEKKSRPIASGEVSILEASLLCFVLFLGGLFMAFLVSVALFYIALAIFALMVVYTLFLKKEPFADILAIAVNFVLRAISGALVLDVRISPWLILCTFFLSLFLSVGKRMADLKLLGKNAVKHKEVFRYYDKSIINSLMVVATVALIISYSLYSFLSIYKTLILSLPFAIYVMFRYTYLANQGNIIARKPEKFFQDKKLTIAISLWTIIALIIIY